MAQILALRRFRAIHHGILRQPAFASGRRTFLFALQAGSPLVRSLFVSLTLLVVAMAVPVAAAQKIQQVSLAGTNAKSAAGETLTASKVDSVNTFGALNSVVPKPFSAKAQDAKLNLKLAPKSVTVVAVEQ